VQDAVGGAGQGALLQAGVVVGADSGELSDLLAAQAGDAAALPVERYAGLLRADPGGRWQRLC
jgi:hypothetical protein